MNLIDSFGFKSLFSPVYNFKNALIPKNEPKLRVLFISHTGDLGGAERSLIDLVHQLKLKGNECRVIIPHTGIIEEKLKDLSINYSIVHYEWWARAKKISKRRFTQISNRNNQAISEIIDQINEFNPDIVYTNTIVIPWGAMAAWLTGKIHVWSVREFGVKDHKLIFDKGYIQSLKIIDQLSDGVFANSKAVKKELAKFINPSKIFQFYNYFRLNKKVFLTNDISDQFNMLIAGSIMPSKGQMDALRALKTLRRKYPVNLTIVGQVTNKNYFKEIKSFIKNNNLKSSVKILKFTDNPYSLMKKADFILVCSKNEAFGRVVAEGMMLKKVIIGTKSGGVIEQIKSSENGYLYKVGDAKQLAQKIENLINHPKLRKRIADNGYRSFRKRFNKANCIDDLVKTLVGLTKENMHKYSI